jgi:hypothetical protein
VTGDCSSPSARNCTRSAPVRTKSTIQPTSESATIEKEI